MTFEQIATTLTLIGVGTVIPTIVSSVMNSRKAKSASKQETKEKRYKAIILLSYAFLNYDKEKSTLIIQRPDIESKEELYNVLHVEWMNMSLYASDKVILRMRNFLKESVQINYNSLILEMRKDLYSVKTKLGPDDLLLTKDC
ncbi:MAG: hypothetical protein AAGG68_15360 [Bacteroidota bacterium]